MERNTATHWARNYQELEAAGRGAFYAAVVRDHVWPGRFVFQAFPHRGNLCTEYVSDDKDAVISVANEWLVGGSPDGLYCSSY